MKQSPQQSAASRERSAHNRQHDARAGIEITLVEAENLVRSGRAAEAVALLDRTTAADPGSAELQMFRGSLLQGLGRLQEAYTAFDIAAGIDPGRADTHFFMATTSEDMGRQEDAAASYRRAVGLNPDYFEAWFNLGVCLQELGRFEEAEPPLKKAVAIRPDLSEAHYQIVRNRKITERDRGEIAKLEALLLQGTLAPKDKCNLRFALGKAYDDLGEWDLAFKNFQAANRLKRAQFKYHRSMPVAQFDRLIETFPRRFFEDRAAFGDESERPIFIVGMARSGSTLVEQILASHPKVYGAGEIPLIDNLVVQLESELRTKTPYPTCVGAIDISTSRRIAGAYLKHLNQLDPEAIRVTDKMLGNFIHLGLIALLFPRARVIHCYRDPIDTCLSCYFQHFTRPSNFAYDLGDLGHYFRAYSRLMAHWRDALPLDMIEISYEDMIADQKSVSRQLVEACGLEWDPACLAYHRNPRPVRSTSLWQVRQPIYGSSVARWRHYEKHLDPLKEALGLTA